MIHRLTGPRAFPTLALTIASLLPALIPPAPAGAGERIATGAEAAGFLERRAEGWFWYQDPPEDAEEDLVPAALPQPSPPLPPKDIPEEVRPAPLPPGPDTAQTETSGPAPLSTAWFRENLQDYMDRAIDDPTPENIRAYTYLERIAGIKSAAFARAKADVTLGNPLLDVTAERPLATYGVQTLDREAFEARQRIIRDLGRDTGLLFFFASSCQLCEAQAYVLRNLADKHGLAIMAVSLDGRPLSKDYLDGAWRPDVGQAAQLGVTEGPALFLMRPPQEVVSLGHGVMDVSMIEERMVRAAHLSGWISEEAWAETQAVRRRTRDVGIPDIPPDILDDPERLAVFLETLLRR